MNNYLYCDDERMVRAQVSTGQIYHLPYCGDDDDGPHPWQSQRIFVSSLSTIVVAFHSFLCRTNAFRLRCGRIKRNENAREATSTEKKKKKKKEEWALRINNLFVIHICRFHSHSIMLTVREWLCEFICRTILCSQCLRLYFNDLLSCQYLYLILMRLNGTGTGMDEVMDVWVFFLVSLCAFSFFDSI